MPATPIVSIPVSSMIAWSGPGPASAAEAHSALAGTRYSWALAFVGGIMCWGYNVSAQQTPPLRHQISLRCQANSA